jgi:phospholipase/carboxylesterase
MTSLTVHSKQPQSGKTKSIVILVHGYGADGQDLVGLADPLAPHMPDTLFLSPDAPNRCSINPGGYEWFPIPRMDGSTEAAMEAGMAASVTALNAFIDKVLAENKLTADRLILLGFSQGTMMSLHVGPRRADQIAGIVGFSGRLVKPELLATEMASKPDVQLIHGDRDAVVPYSDMADAAKALTAAGVSVQTFTSPGTAHGIAPDGLGVALVFMLEQLKP